LSKLKESVQGVVKKIKEEFTANKTETGTSIEGMNKEIIAIKSKIDALPTAEVKADPASEVKPSLTSNEDIKNLKKESEETKTNLNKLKENVYNK
jgi:predicted  nucleic acid-binding Zn-ribbon protein